MTTELTWNEIENGPIPLCMRCGKEKELYGPYENKICIDCMSTILELPHIQGD